MFFELRFEELRNKSSYAMRGKLLADVRSGLSSDLSDFAGAASVSLPATMLSLASNLRLVSEIIPVGASSSAG